MSIPVDLLRGDYISAGLDLVGAIPFVGEVADVVKCFKTADKIVDAAQTVDKTIDVVKTADKAVDAYGNGFRIYKDGRIELSKIGGNKK